MMGVSEYKVNINTRDAPKGCYLSFWAIDFEKGNSNDEVRNLQNRLKNIIYLEEPVEN